MIFESWKVEDLPEEIAGYRKETGKELRDCFPEISLEYELNYVRILDGLFKEDLEERLSITELAEDRWLRALESPKR